jgi:hypothetical protein
MDACLWPPNEEVFHSVVHCDGGRRWTSDVEVDFAGRLCALGDGGPANVGRANDLPQNAVDGLVGGDGIELRNSRGDGPLDGVDGGGGFPEVAGYGVTLQRIGAGLEIAGRPVEHDLADGINHR